jgi:hypothetical protein
MASPGIQKNIDGADYRAHVASIELHSASALAAFSTPDVAGEQHPVPRDLSVLPILHGLFFNSRVSVETMSRPTSSDVIGKNICPSRTMRS